MHKRTMLHRTMWLIWSCKTKQHNTLIKSNSWNQLHHPGHWFVQATKPHSVCGNEALGSYIYSSFGHLHRQWWTGRNKSIAKISTWIICLEDVWNCVWTCLTMLASSLELTDLSSWFTTVSPSTFWRGSSMRRQGSIINESSDKKIQIFFLKKKLQPEVNQTQQKIRTSQWEVLLSEQQLVPVKIFLSLVTSPA